MVLMALGESFMKKENVGGEGREKYCSDVSHGLHIERVRRKDSLVDPRPQRKRWWIRPKNWRE